MTVVLAYHKLTRWEWGGTWVSPNEFKKQLQYIKSRNIRVVKPEEFDVDSKRTGILITFDDGYADIYKVAFPLLEELHFSALVFLVVNYIGKENIWDANIGFRRYKHLNWHQIREMQRYGIKFGSHSLTHPDLRKVARVTAIREIMDSKRLLEDKLGESVDYFSYPFGLYNEELEDMVATAGYKCAFSLNPFSSSRWSYGRLAVYVIDTLWWFKNKIYPSSPLFKVEQFKSRAINRFGALTFIWKQLITRV